MSRRQSPFQTVARAVLPTPLCKPSSPADGHRLVGKEFRVIAVSTLERLQPLSPAAAGPTSSTRVMNAFRAIIRASRTSTRALEMRFGTSAAQLFMLRALQGGEVGSVKELAHRTNTHNSSASVVVRRLCERGFVRRIDASDDRRRVGYAITPEGSAFLAASPRSVDDILLSGLSTMPAEDRQQLADLLATLIARSEIPMCDSVSVEDAAD